MKRYEPYCNLWSGTCDAEVREKDNGEFVYYEEVEAELARLRAELHRSDVALSESPFHGQEELAEASLADGIRNYRNAVEAELARLRAENKTLQADAALVRAVRRIPDMAKLWHAESRWYLHPGDAPCLPLGTGNSLEAALKAAGLMEGEEK